MKFSAQWLVGAALGALVGASVVWVSGGGEGAESMPTAEKTPLYWVAPMDPNYRRDKPGKSPMGMDLIPVYADEASADSPGTVKISPEVINNLGVRTALVERGRLGSSIETVGYVQYDEDRRIEISPRVEGWVEKLGVKAVGDPVQRGQALYEIYSPLLVNAQNEYLLAKKRNNQLLMDASIERLRALQLPEAEIQRLAKRGQSVRRIAIPAPQSGVIEELAVREGMFVKPGMSLMTISMLEHIWVIGEVFERHVAQVEIGDPVSMQFDYLPGRQWVGRVDYVYPSLNAMTRTAKVRVHFDNPDGFLKPGMLAAMSIDTGVSDEALLLPQEALIRTGKQNRVVLALGDGKFKSVAIEIGRIDEKRVEVLAGLSLGERVVISAQFLIDSESSKTSDFKRMSSADDKATSPSSVWLEARVENVMPEHRMVTLAHPAIPEWQWPAMTMDFTVTEAVSLDQFVAEGSVQVQLSKSADGKVALTNVRVPDDLTAPDAASDAPAETHGSQLDVDHSDMDHSGMDHSESSSEEADASGKQSTPKHAAGERE